MSTQLPEWPPSFTDAQKTHLLSLATTYSLGHGFTLLPPAFTSPPTSAIPAPLALCPTPFPRHLYQLAIDIQPVYNALYVNVSQDVEFLDRVMGGVVSKVDEFQGRLWRHWKACRDDLTQPLQLGLFRSDYLLHQSSSDASLSALELKQVEFNTISSSFGALSEHAAKLHKYLLSQTAYFEASPVLQDADALPPNHSMRDLAKGLAAAHSAYLTAAPQEEPKETRVLFVVQDGERNIFDQLWLEWKMLEDSGVKCIRQTFAQVAKNARVDDTSPYRRLYIKDELYPSTLPKEYEISVAYYRAAYTPSDYPTEAEWKTRELLERTFAIKCPSLALQLAGAKKVQQVLAEPGVLEDFLIRRPTTVNTGTGGDRLVTTEDIEALRHTFTDLYPMDDSELGKKAQALARDHPEGYVLKPQREGGGNNIYRENIPPFLQQLEEEEAVEAQKLGLEGRESTADNSASDESSKPPPKREGYILMSLIDPPQHVRNLLVKGGSKDIVDGPVVSELGVYGVALFKGPPANDSDRGRGIDLTYGATAGTLFRTKGRESDEGGVAVGYSVVDSLVLV